MTITGERLRLLREQRGQSQEEIAKLIGVGRTTYLKYETGENKPTRKLKELSALFNVTTDYIMGVSDNPHGKPFGGQDGKHFLLFAGQQPQQSEPTITPEELALIEAYRKASERDKNIVDAVLKPNVSSAEKEIG